MRSQSSAGNILLASIERIRVDRFVRMVRRFHERGETLAVGDGSASISGRQGFCGPL